MRFGESFPTGADPTNRMNVIKIKEDAESVPEYIRVGLEIRKKLEERVATLGWPELPDNQEIGRPEDLFARAQSEVDQAWQESVEGIITDKASHWAENLNDNSSESLAARELLNNPDELKKGLSLRQFGVLEVLRKSEPDAWRELVIASSERQLASIAILEHWIRHSDNEKLELLCQKIGLSVPELSLFVDTAAILGKYIDHAYVKQIELADKPGGSTESKLSQEEGAEYIYDLYRSSESDDIDIKTYSDIFPYEWPKIEARFRALSLRAQKEVEEKKLPESYNNYAALLNKMADVYGSSNIDPEVLQKEWTELYELFRNTNDDDCPLMIIPQGCAAVAGEAGKVDAEIRLGLRTKETKNQERNFNEFTNIGQDILDGYRSSLNKEYTIPKVNLNYQPWAFGPNLYWHTRGESHENSIMSHTNAVTETALARELPLVNRVFNEQGLDDKEYAKAAVVETVLHETGHNVVDLTDKLVVKRIGRSAEVDIIEELKAEVIGMKILETAISKGSLPPEIDTRSQLLAKIGANLDYLKNKSSEKASSGEPYYICGATIIGRLLSKGLLVKKDNAYEIGDTVACIKEIAAISEEIMPLYVSEQSKPADAKSYVKSLREKCRDQQLLELLKAL